MQMELLRDKYEIQRTSLVRWLDSRPDTVDKLRAVMSSITAVKSKLRHRIADCQDLQDVSRSLRLSVCLSVCRTGRSVKSG